jgi:hypothetical protein
MDLLTHGAPHTRTQWSQDSPFFATTSLSPHYEIPQPAAPPAVLSLTVASSHVQNNASSTSTSTSTAASASQHDSTQASDATPQEVLSPVQQRSSRSGSSSPTRRVQWPDDASSGRLARAVLFKQSDEVWKCTQPNNDSVIHAPSSTPIRAHLVGDIPKHSEQMSARLQSAGVQLESITISSPRAFL